MVRKKSKGGVVLGTRRLAGTWLSRRKDGVTLKADPGLTREGDNRKKESIVDLEPNVTEFLTVPTFIVWRIFLNTAKVRDSEQQ